MLLSKFFGKSKPIVFLSLAVYISIHFWVHMYWNSSGIGLADVGKYGLLLLLFFGVNFIVKRNKITRKNALAALFFSMLCTAIPEFYIDFNYLIPAFFVVLGLRRIISLKTQIDSKKKIFDATLWFFVASLFQPYLLLLMILVLYGIIQYSLYEPKNLLIPFIAWACGSLLLTTYHFWKTEEWVFFYDYYLSLGWNDFEAIWLHHSIAISPLIPLTLFVLFGVNKVIHKAQLGLKTSLILLILAFVFMLSGWMFSATNQAGGLGIASIPFSMLAATSLEIKMKPILKEVILGLMILVSVLSFWV